MIEVQLDKSGRAAFRLNSGIGPLEGVRDQFGYFAPGKLWVHYLDEYCETYRSPAFRRWFAARRNWFGTSTSKEDYRNLVKNHLYVVDELEGFFRSGKLGRHMRRIKK